MLHLSVDQGQLFTGILSQKGMQGMWLFWASWLGVYVVPIVFAPVWKKLNFITDNEFLLFRFPGQSGRVLHAFRAFYVGGLVAALLISFHLIGAARVMSVYFDISEFHSTLITGAVIGIFALKNVFDLKIKTDGLHYILFLIALIAPILFIWQHSNGWQGIEKYFSVNPSKNDIFPEWHDTGNWFSILVFIGVQWWSCNLFDGGGPEMARFTATKDTKRAMWAGLISPVMSLFIGSLLLFQVLLVLGTNDGNMAGNEKMFVTTIFAYTPEYLNGLVFLGFFGMFITTVEALLNWGGSFLTIDLYQKHGNPNASAQQIRRFSFIAMVALSLCATFFALQINNLESLIKITFSIAAGVAPVYILRWVWYRINAWSQLSAMISSGIFTILYPHLHYVLPLKEMPMTESRILVVTVLTTIIWVIVTLFTSDQSPQVVRQLAILDQELSVRYFMRRFIFAVLLGLICLISVVLFWYYMLFKFT
jgi:solute:Na+ symporter, SSS family